MSTNCHNCGAALPPDPALACSYCGSPRPRTETPDFSLSEAARFTYGWADPRQVFGACQVPFNPGSRG